MRLNIYFIKYIIYFIIFNRLEESLSIATKKLEEQEKKISKTLEKN
jgi:hypothetical protein